MDSEFLTIRLSSDDASMIRRLRKATGLSKTELVKRALRSFGAGTVPPEHREGLFALGLARFGRHGDARRQSSSIKRIARSRANAKRIGR